MAYNRHLMCRALSHAQPSAKPPPRRSAWQQRFASGALFIERRRAVFCRRARVQHDREKQRARGVHVIPLLFPFIIQIVLAGKTVALLLRGVKQQFQQRLLQITLFHFPDRRHADNCTLTFADD